MGDRARSFGEALARFARPLASRTVLLLFICAALLPLAFTYLGRLPLLLMLAGLVVYTGLRTLRCIPSTYGAQAISAGFVVIFYLCGALTSVKPESLGNVDFANHTGFYAGVAESILHGELRLPAEPATALLRAKNPYALDRPRAFVWDASYYQGKYYVYFGPTPVLTLYLPFRVVTQRPLPAPLALFIFLSAGFVGSLFVLERARKACALRIPAPAVQVLTTLLLGLSSLGPVMLRRPSVYEVAIASAYCFFMWGTYLLLGLLPRQSDSHAFRRATLASLLLGLSAGSRATFVASGLLLVIALLAQVRQHWKFERWAVLQRSVALLVPFGFCMFLLGLYNKARFDAWSEFGLRYQLNHIDLMNVKFSADKLMRGVSYYLFSAPTVSRGFPPIHVDQTTSPFGFGHHPTIHEGVLGLFPTMPVTFVLVVAPLLMLRRANLRFNLVLVSLVGYALLMLLAVSAAGVSPRYETDFVPTLLVAGALTFYALRSIESRAVALAAEVLWLPAAFYTIALSVLASLSDEATPNSLNTYYPAVFSLIRRVLWP